MTVFIIAMESEAQPFIDALADTQIKKVHGRTVITGKLNHKPAAAVVCGVGKVNAAAGAQYAIDCLGADKIVNIGFAGGLNAGTQIGKIYSISQVVQYDFDLSVINGTPIGTLNEYTEPYISVDCSPRYPAKKLGTGDRFDDSERDYLLLSDALKADVRDMEFGAIAHVCKHAGVQCYSFKAISDVAGAGSTTKQFAINLAMCAKALSEEFENIFEAVNG